MNDISKSEALSNIGSSKDIKAVLKIIDGLLEGKRFGVYDSKELMYLFNAQSRIEEMLNGDFDDSKLMFLKGSIDSLFITLSKANEQIEKYFEKREEDT